MSKAVEQKDNGMTKLAAALAKAFGEMTDVVVDANNPHFGNNYATLGAVLRKARPILAKHGLAIVQAPGPITDGNVTLTTLLVHESGEHLVFNGQAPITAQTDKKTGASKVTAQAMGSAISYLRRYTAMAILGLSQADDDGEAASSDPTPPNAAVEETPKPKKEKPKKEAAEEPTEDSYAEQKEALVVLIGASISREDLETHKAAVLELNDDDVGKVYVEKLREFKKSKK